MFVNHMEIDSIHVHDHVSQRMQIYTKLICVDYGNLLTEHMIFLITVSKAMQLLLHGNTWQGQIKDEQSLFQILPTCLYVSQRGKKVVRTALIFDFSHT